MARRLRWKFSRIARAWARGVGAPAGGSSTRSARITAATRLPSWIDAIETVTAVKVDKILTVTRLSAPLSTDWPA
jgi:hypothetical protein